MTGNYQAQWQVTFKAVDQSNTTITDGCGVVVNSSAANPVVMIQGPYVCGTTDGAQDITFVNDAGNSGYQYDPTTNTWQFNWQIKGSPAGCYDIYIKSQQSGQTNGPYPISVVSH